MKKKDFLTDYLHPSEPGLDPGFIHPLPNIPALQKCGDFIVQCELDDTFSTNIITKYVSEPHSIKLVEVYKNTQNKKTGVFIRLVGTVSLVKSGFPAMFLDAAVSNINPMTSQKEDITTRVAIHLPQAEANQRAMFFNSLNAKAQDKGTVHRELHRDTLPQFWGSLWLGQSKGFDPDLIRDFRSHAWEAYSRMAQDTSRQEPFDYSAMKNHIIFNNSKAEHLMFKKMGLSVPMEAQAAFFSAMVTGIE